MTTYSDEDILQMIGELEKLQGYLQTIMKCLEETEQEKQQAIAAERQRCLSAAKVPQMACPNQATAQSIVNAVIHAWGTWLRSREGDWSPAQIVHEVREALDKVCEQVATGTAAAIALEIQTGGKGGL